MVPLKRDHYQRDDFVFFWSTFMSQWAFYDMVVDGVKYGTCEQYMMAGKARLFGDADTLARIMEASQPWVQKDLGKQVKNFDKALWQEHCREIVYQGNLAKFSQHENLKTLILGTDHKVIVEASPQDFVWGIGLAEKSPDAPVPARWKGSNYLGQCLMAVRDTLLEGNYDATWERYDVRT